MPLIMLYLLTYEFAIYHFLQYLNFDEIRDIIVFSIGGLIFFVFAGYILH